MNKKELELRAYSESDDVTFPHEVVELELEHNNIIKAWRLHLKMTLKEVAQKAGITPDALSQIEKPTSKFHKATLKKLAKALSIDVRQLDLED